MEKFSIKILFLPVPHPELNPTEMVWLFVKQSLGSRNLKFNLSTVEELTEEQIVKVSPELFKKYYFHACREELSIISDT